MVRSLLFVLLLTACADAAPTGPDGVALPPLNASVWYAHASQDAALPAKVREVNLGGVIEADYVDSLRLEIAANGTWTKAAWHHRFRDGTLHHWAAHHESGVWEVRDDRYVFTNSDGEEAFVLSAAPTNGVELALRYTGATPAQAFTLRSSVTPPSFHGRWRAATLEGVALPAVLYHNLHEPTPGGGASSWALVVDSAVVILLANGRYLQHIYFSEFHGEAGEQPSELFHRFYAGDRGFWVRGDNQLQLESDWLEGHAMLGAVASTGAGGLTLRHGITHGDEPALFLYHR